MNPIEEIKARLDIVDIVSETVQLRKSGRNYMGFCPFHNNTRSPAFSVNAETQTWRCFSECADGGDIFSFVMKKNGWDFKETLKHLAKRANVTLEEMTPKQKQRKSIEEGLAELLDAAADYFHQLFLYAPQANQARTYISGRGLTAETIETFRVGFALDSWDACRSHFMGQGYSEQDLLDVGLLTENPEKGTRYDRFRNRIVIPIRDVSGRTVGFGARTLDPDGIPKYLNSPQTLLFDKSHVLFGLDMAKRQIREARQAVIVEGYMDVITAWQGGFKNVVAQMGTALTPTQLQLLKKQTKRFVIALDADAAGIKATMRSLTVARQTLDREVEIRFDPTGLIREEGRLQADIRIATMPEGKDPDDIIRSDPAVWQRLIKEAKTVVEFVVGNLIADIDLNNPHQKGEVARQVIPLIRDITDPIVRDHYWQYLARTLKIDERALRRLKVEDRQQRRESQRPVIDKQSANGRGKPNEIGAARPAAGPRIARGGIRDPLKIILAKESNFLGECLADPHKIGKVNRLLSQIGQPVVHVEDFSQAIDRTIFLIIHQTYTSGSVVTIREMWDSLEEHTKDRILELEKLPRQSEKDPVRSLTQSLLDCRLENIKRMVSEAMQHIRDAKEIADEDAVGMFTQHVESSTRLIQQVHKAKSALTAHTRKM